MAKMGIQEGGKRYKTEMPLLRGNPQDCITLRAEPLQEGIQVWAMAIGTGIACRFLPFPLPPFSLLASYYFNREVF
jgi:hypothetical protein